MKYLVLFIIIWAQTLSWAQVRFDQALFRIEKRVFMAQEIPELIKGLKAFTCVDKSTRVLNSAELSLAELEKFLSLSPKDYENHPVLLKKLVTILKLKIYYELGHEVIPSEFKGTCLGNKASVHAKSFYGLEIFLEERDRQIDQKNTVGSGPSLYVDSLLRRYEHEIFLPTISTSELAP